MISNVAGDRLMMHITKFTLLETGVMENTVEVQNKN
jgi:hypothetical protein